MSFTTAIATCFSKYATFSGRASRSEFWWFVLFMSLVFLLATVVGESLVQSDGGSEQTPKILKSVAYLALWLPSLAVGCRRLHDIGRSGWWQLLTFTGIGNLLLFVWWIFRSDAADNAYGPPPASAALPAAA